MRTVRLMLALAGAMLISPPVLAADSDSGGGAAHQGDGTKPAPASPAGAPAQDARAPAGVTHEYHRAATPPAPPPAPDPSQAVVKSKSNITNN